MFSLQTHDEEVNKAKIEMDQIEPALKESLENCNISCGEQHQAFLSLRAPANQKHAQNKKKLEFNVGIKEHKTGQSLPNIRNCNVGRLPATSKDA